MPLPPTGHVLVLLLGILLFRLLPLVVVFDMTVNTNLAIYWGQNSYSATNPADTANWQQPIAYYCQDATVDIIPMAFLDIFNMTGSLPSINLTNTCSTSSNGVFPGTQLPNCTSLASDIQACQNAGKIVTISLGGATGAVSFPDNTVGSAFTKIIWDLFLGGMSNTCLFGDVVLDGIDMDIKGGSQTGFTAFLTTLHQLMNGGNKPYYITAAPQCPYSDVYIGNTINTVPFDAVFVQFYNNYCGLNNYNNPNAWNFATWDNWAKTVSPNPNVKVFIGAPASPGAAGSGYVDPLTIATIIQQTKGQYTSFGGVMLWDMSQAHANNRYDMSVKAALTGSSMSVTSTIPVSTIVPVPTTSTTPGGPGSCVGVSPWQSNIVYLGGHQVTYNHHLWGARWWTYDNIPGSLVGVWIDEGSCTMGVMTAVLGQGHLAQATFGVFPAMTTNAP